jgi:hypothetical protein
MAEVEKKDSVVSIHFSIDFDIDNLKKIISENAPFLAMKILEAVSAKKEKKC